MGFMASDSFSRPGLTGIRALAALLVVGHHLNAIVGPRMMFTDPPLPRVEFTHLFTIGWVGVNVFFVLSAFLLTVHLMERLQGSSMKELLGPYLMARVLRVVPAYWVQIAVLFVVAWITVGTVPDWWVYIPAHAVFLQNLSFQAQGAINGVYWSLPVEFFFYLALPVIVAFVSSALLGGLSSRGLVARACVVLLVAIAITLAWRYFVFNRYQPFGIPRLFWSSTQLPGLADQFGLGVLAACVFVATGSPHASRSRGWSLASDVLVLGGLAGLVATMYLMHYAYPDYWGGKALFYSWNLVASAFVACCVFGAAVGGRISRLAFETRVALFVGTVSYGMYLWHYPVAAYIANHVDMKGVGLGLFALWALPAILAVSAASYYLVEKPAFDLRRRRMRSAPAATGAPAEAIPSAACEAGPRSRP
jgi:peptidoglycan/LPS O-acetylase OafA/YrhL